MIRYYIILDIITNQSHNAFKSASFDVCTPQKVLSEGMLARGVVFWLLYTYEYNMVP